MLFNASVFRDNPVYFGAVALHETLHLKAHFTLEVEEGEGGGIDITFYREGVGIKALQADGYHGRYHQHFTGLHEAIVAELEKRSLAKIINLPELAREKEWLESAEAGELKHQLAERRGISEDDIIWVGKKGDKDWETVSYCKTRDVLTYVCTEIQKQFPAQYSRADEVFTEFQTAHFTGQLLPIARLVEATFGAGSFRLLGNMSTDKESAVLHLESLKKARVRQLKN